jgi:hypothetical protein
MPNIALFTFAQRTLRSGDCLPRPWQCSSISFERCLSIARRRTGVETFELRQCCAGWSAKLSASPSPVPSERSSLSPDRSPAYVAQITSQTFSRLHWLRGAERIQFKQVNIVYRCATQHSASCPVNYNTSSRWHCIGSRPMLSFIDHFVTLKNLQQVIKVGAPNSLGPLAGPQKLGGTRPTGLIGWLSLCAWVTCLFESIFFPPSIKHNTA